MEFVSAKTPIVSTTGFPSRELYELREKFRGEKTQDFLCVGSMGHASSIGLGVLMGMEAASPSASANVKSNKVCVLDGDGGALMHLGAVGNSGAIGDERAGASKKGSFLHVVLNNGLHESVGAQPTAA